MKTNDGRTDIDTTTLDLGHVTVTLAVDAGPRVLGYARVGGPQLFASLPGEVIEHPAIGSFRFLGGHRLWLAPEVPSVTYQPDDGPVTLTEAAAGVELAGTPDPLGIAKAIALTQHDRFTIVEHELHNEGPAPVRCAPWAITQFAPGGTAFLPQTREPADADGVLPNRQVVLWPYTDLSQVEIEFRAADVVVHSSHRPSRSKVGLPNRRGWIAYLLGDELFVKWSKRHRDSEEYADCGASAQCYRDERFIELETLGPLVTVNPGEHVSHREVWTLIDVSQQTVEEVLDALPSVPTRLIQR